MPELTREIFIRLHDDVRIRYRRSEAPPPYRYAITLEARRGGRWVEIALWDNAHDLDEHHEHEYTREQGKRPPTVHEFESTNEAMAAAMRKAGDEWPRILSSWSESR